MLQLNGCRCSGDGGIPGYPGLVCYRMIHTLPRVALAHRVQPQCPLPIYQMEPVDDTSRLGRPVKVWQSSALPSSMARLHRALSYFNQFRPVRRCLSLHHLKSSSANWIWKCNFLFLRRIKLQRYRSNSAGMPYVVAMLWLSSDTSLSERDQVRALLRLL